MIVVRRNSIYIMYPTHGRVGRKLIEILKKKYGVKGEVREVLCG